MPLIKSASDKARSENIKKELMYGRPKKQAIAIAYATQLAEKHKKKKK